MRIVASCWGFLTGMARRRTESISWKMAVLAPMPSARVRTEMMVKPGLRRRSRKAWRRLCQNEAISTPWEYKTTGEQECHVAALGKKGGLKPDPTQVYQRSEERRVREEEGT